MVITSIPVDAGVAGPGASPPWSSTDERDHRHKTRGATSRKLTPDEAREIYHRVHAGERGVGLAEEFKVSPTTITHIKQGKVYAHFTTEDKECSHITSLL